jgi:hydrophobe/amphiphile efflux-1 (HAE1) family protein
MHLSELSIRRPVFAWMLMAALIVFGALSFHRLGISQLPDVDFPVVGVSASLPGAAPEVMESQVLDPLEDSIMQIDGIRSVTSSAQQASASISIEFELDRNIDIVMQEVQDRINQVLNLLPTDLIPPTVRKTNPEDQPILWLSLSNDGSISTMDMMSYARNYLYDQFGTVTGVGNIVLGGYVDGALRVWLNSDKLKQKDLAFDDITNAITSEHVEYPAGVIANGSREYNVRFMGEAATAEDFGKIRINSRSGLGANFAPQKLSDVADIEEGTVDVRRLMRSDGKQAVGLGILKQHGSNAVEVARLVREKLALLNKTMPKAYQLSVRSDNTRFISQSVNQLNFTLLLSALLTSVVCYLFLGSWASTVNVLMAIPTSIVGAFSVIYFMGFTLNTFTLLGLSLAIGIVVDDAIMMLENIVRHQELGEKKRSAALKGAKEITPAAIAATLAVVAIFLPVVFMKGVIGRYFFQYGVTVTAAVLLSLLEALTLTPMRCSQYLTIHHHTTGFAAKIDVVFRKLASLYQSVLEILLSHRWKTLAVTFGIFAGSWIIAKHLPGEMLPAQDQSQLLLRLKAPVGSAIGFTDSKFRIAEQYLLTVPEVAGMMSMVGGFGGDAVNQGMVYLSLVDRTKRKVSQQDLMKSIRAELYKRIKGIEIVVQDLSLRGFAATRGFPVEFIIQGPDWDKLTDLTTNKIIPAMKKLGSLTDVNTDIQPGMPEFRIIPDRKKMAERAVPITSVTTALNTLFAGDILRETTEYTKGTHRYSIEVRLIASQRDQASQLDTVRVRNNRGELSKLSDLVTREEKPSLMLISRLNRARAITVYANPAAGHSQNDAMAETEKLARSMLPPGYSLKMIGSSQSYQESFQSLISALLLGILVSYMVLASQFNSFIHPVIILMALPFSFTGAFIALAIGHQSINIYSLIGFILLMGIVKKNSILLVDFTNQCRAEGLTVHDALIKACPVRLRPILMTSVATVAGALPEALSLGPGAETTIPMAIAIIGGVIASTILTLFVVPCAYSLMTKLERPDPLVEALLKESRAQAALIT